MKIASLIHGELDDDIGDHIVAAQERYGGFASTHEALGVLLEEWNELQDAVRANKLESVREEAIDLAAVCIRLADQCRRPSFQSRSQK